MNKIQKMIETQHSVNARTSGEDWHTQGLDWRLAIMQEGSELIDSFNWPWWKQLNTDLLNAKIEVIDILHFNLSILYEEGANVDEIYEEKLKALSTDQELTLPRDMNLLIKYLKNIVKVAANDRSGVEIADALFLAAGKIGITFDEIVKMYFGKSVLNKFRQDNGYSQGAYIKIWNDVEDNFVMADLISDIEYNDDFEDHLYMLLTERYMIVS